METMVWYGLVGDLGPYHRGIWSFQEMLRLEVPCFVILEPLSVYEVEAARTWPTEEWLVVDEISSSYMQLTILIYD